MVMASCTSSAMIVQNQSHYATLCVRCGEALTRARPMHAQVVRTLLARLKEQANTRFAVSALEEPVYGAL